MKLKECTILLLATPFFIFLLMPCCVGAGSSQSDNCVQNSDAGNDLINNSSSTENGREKLEAMFSRMGFLSYFDARPTRMEPGPDGYTYYYFNENDVLCFYGDEAHVAVSEGSSNNVMFYLEGGGARWPGGGFAITMDYPYDLSFKSRDQDNPLRDWTFVYVPYCDESLHMGDNIVDYYFGKAYQWGMRHTAAAVSVMKELFPYPDKILVTGISAGAYGTYVGWAIVKSQYMDTDTYILSDGGVGFYNPHDPATWDTILQSWNLRVPEDCTKCDGPINTYLFETYMNYDPQVRIGMFSSYYDEIISQWFLKMDPYDFRQTLMRVTNDIKRSHSDRFSRFFVKGNCHTSLFLPGGPEYEVQGVSYYEWIGQLVNEDPAWRDYLE